MTKQNYEEEEISNFQITVDLVMKKKRMFMILQTFEFLQFSRKEIFLLSHLLHDVKTFLKKKKKRDLRQSLRLKMGSTRD